MPRQFLFRLSNRRLRILHDLEGRTPAGALPSVRSICANRSAFPASNESLANLPWLAQPIRISSRCANWMGRNCTLAFLVFALAFIGCRGDSVVQSTARFPGGNGFQKREFVFEGKPKTLWVFL